MKLCGNLKKPSEADKQKLATLFPGPDIKKVSSTFDPKADCIVDSQKRKKKKAITRDRPKKISVVLLPDFMQVVPKGNARKRLNKDGRIKKLEFRRNMSFLQARNVIVKSFAGFKLKDIQVLCCDQSNAMEKAATQTPNGDELMDIAGQGSLYICEVSYIFYGPVITSHWLMMEISKLV